MSKRIPIGTVVDARSDGSFLYMSHKGLLNLDNSIELEEAAAEDRSFIKVVEESPTSPSEKEKAAIKRGSDEYYREINGFISKYLRGRNPRSSR